MSAEAGSAPALRQLGNLSSGAPVIMGSAAPESVAQANVSTAVAVEEAPPVSASSNVNGVRDAVLNALGDAGHRMLVTMLETGEWTIEGTEVVIRVAASATVIDMSVGADAKRLAMATASGVMGHAMKFKVLPGGTAQAAPPRPASSSNGGGRARAEQDPIVRRMQEKFGAEIRIIIDERDKK